MVRAAKPYSCTELTTPSAPFRRLRSIFLMAQPPLLCEEGNERRYPFTSLLHSDDRNSCSIRLADQVLPIDHQCFFRFDCQRRDL